MQEAYTYFLPVFIYLQDTHEPLIIIVCTWHKIHFFKYKVTFLNCDPLYFWNAWRGINIAKAGPCSKSIHCSTNSITSSFSMGGSREMPLSSCTKIFMLTQVDKIPPVLIVYCCSIRNLFLFVQKCMKLFSLSGSQRDFSEGAGGQPLYHDEDSRLLWHSIDSTAHQHSRNKWVYGCLWIIPVELGWSCSTVENSRKCQPWPKTLLVVSHILIPFGNKIVALRWWSGEGGLPASHTERLADGLNGGSVNWDPLPVGYTVNQAVIHYWWFYFHSADDSTPILLIILLPFYWWFYSHSTDDSTTIVHPFYWWFYSQSTDDSTRMPCGVTKK